MSDTVSFAELEAQHAELLPARTVLSLFSVGKPGTPGVGRPGLGFNIGNLSFPLNAQSNIAGAGVGGAPGSAN